MTVSRYMLEKLQERSDQHALRSLSEPPMGTIDFASNDYLGLSKNKEITDLGKELFDRSGIKEHGATGSRLISGNHSLYAKTEQEIAAIHQSEDALLFHSGYVANLALLSCIAGRHDTIIYDERVHASLRDGIRLSLARSFSFQHNDINDLSKKVYNSVGQVFIVTESIFSMDGDEAPLQEIANLAKIKKAFLIVDEAHALGVKGWGIISQLGIQQDVFARIVTFGKALGTHGAAVLVNKQTKDFLVNFSRPLIYTTGMPPPQVAQILAAYQYLKSHPESIHQLEERIQFFSKNCQELEILPSQSAIQCLVIPGNERVMHAEKVLLKAGFFVKAIKHPTVAKGFERIRICIHSYNTTEEISALLTELKKWRANYL